MIIYDHSQLKASRVCATESANVYPEWQLNGVKGSVPNLRPRQCGHIADLLHRWEEATSIVGLPAVVGIRDGSNISRPCDTCTWFPFMLSFGTGTVQFPSFLEVDSANRWNDWLHGAHLRKTIECHGLVSVVHAVNMNQHPSWYLMSVQLYRIIPCIYI